MKPDKPVNLVNLTLARKVLQTEASAILGLLDQLDKRFEHSVQILFECQGRVIVTGVGKSGIICRKIAATLSSTGTPSFFLHPSEAIHGDLGVVQQADVVLALSHSGATGEILRLLETIRRVGSQLIAITGFLESPLAQAADVALPCRISQEACPLNLVPTASTTAALALGDALAMTLLVKRGFREDDFANLHPGGELGKRLLRVERLMHTGTNLPVVAHTAPMKDATDEISNKGLGITCVTDVDGHLIGIVTDGDLRRHLTTKSNIMDQTVSEVMTKAPLTIARSALAAQALNIMEQHKITSLVVIDNKRIVEGVVHLHDLWRTELF